MDDLKGKLTKAEAAAYLGWSVSHLSTRIWQKEGPRHIKYGGRLYFDKKDLEQYKKSLIEIRAS